ncbi:redoxin domain-containing protein [Pedobacter endophyticus]|uniref:Redoxin domain-containing protein n=1 Tax=Pedobacter endophyticus TaxID=2789740 RepID=A0A7S9L268_9SPHI|nr:redoxin domain-containing protein [Pedobacter endophyticus]QPH41154.1 redoxin domain-containing protein [Pedobacter endophyticus]
MRLISFFLSLSLFSVIFLHPKNTEAQEHIVSAKELEAIKLINLQGKQLSLTLKGAIVVVFLSPECPLCKNYLPTLKKLQGANPQVAFYGIFPGKSYSLKEINDLRNEYNINFALLKDSDKKLSAHLSATTTPEVVVINKLGAITYRGLIDNWASSLGKKRLVITERYLEDALADLLNGKQTFKETSPIGCLINDI